MVTVKKWRLIGSIPKWKKGGDVPWKYIVWLYDPDNTVGNRIQIGFWNSNYDGYQSLFSESTLMRPTHWAPVNWPDPPLEEARAEFAVSENNIKSNE